VSFVREEAVNQRSKEIVQECVNSDTLIPALPSEDLIARRPGNPWVPGISGNPRGTQKYGQALMLFREASQKLLSEKDTEGRPAVERIVGAGIEHAIAGKIEWAEFLRDSSGESQQGSGNVIITMSGSTD
jgi:hypothetical protein